MGRIKAKQTIIVEPEDSADVQKVWEWLNENIEFDIEGEWIDIYKDSYIEGRDVVSGYYEPEVRYTSNGDGNPASYDLDAGIDEEWLHDEILEKLGIECHVSCIMESE